MSGKDVSNEPRSEADRRAERLKQALKENLARRKAQARGRKARAAQDRTGPEADGEQEG